MKRTNYNNPYASKEWLLQKVCNTFGVITDVPHPQYVHDNKCGKRKIPKCDWAKKHGDINYKEMHKIKPFLCYYKAYPFVYNRNMQYLNPRMINKNNQSTRLV